MRIGIIGPGRVGTALGETFKNAGYEIVGVVSRQREHAKKCMRVVGCKYWSANPQDIAKISDIILIAVPDSQIKSVAAELALPPETVVVHTSGTLPSSILGTKHSLSMHPITSFAGGKLPHGTYFGIEGEVEVGERLVKSIGGIPIIISSEHKALYHAALNFGASYLLTLLNTGAELLKISGINEPEKVILSLATSTLRNAKTLGIQNSLTGPIERGDTRVVEKEIKAIKEKALEDLEMYRVLAKETEKFARNILK